MTTKESPEVGAAAARMIRALVDRAADKDTEALEQLVALEQLISQATTRAGWELHEAGYSHTELAAVVGVSRQASVKRFGRGELNPTSRLFLTRTISAAGYLAVVTTRLSARRSA